MCKDKMKMKKLAITLFAASFTDALHCVPFEVKG